MRIFLIALTGILLLASTTLKAQTNQKADSIALMQIIKDVFDGMRTGDSSRISQHFSASVIMHSVALKSEGQNKLFTEGKASAWLEAVGKPKNQVWDERTANYKLNITEGLATVWMDYAFFIDDQLSHCGVNSFQLVKLMGKWKIIYIIDTRKREGCNISAF